MQPSFNYVSVQILHHLSEPTFSREGKM